MFKHNDTIIPLDTPFEIDGTSYPANWLRLTSLAEKQAVGIEEVPDVVTHYDDRFYWGPGNPKDIEQVRANVLAQVKQVTYSLLSPTDYKLIRKAETGEAVDAATLAHRDAVRKASATNQTLVNAATTVDQIAALQFTWPIESK